MRGVMATGGEMSISDLLEIQWNGYSKVHSSRLNLVIHIISVPLFIAGCLSTLLSLLMFSLVGVFVSVFTVALAFGAQGIGHSKEQVAADPFTGFKQAITRIIFEQFITFPKFVISGSWYAALNSTKQ